MPTAPLRPCTKHGCPQLVTSGTCPTHRTQDRQRYDHYRGSASSRGYGAQWRRLRHHILLAEPLCRICKAEGHINPATDVDHITPRSHGGTDDPSNLQSLCHSCHSRKTATDGRRGIPGRDSFRGSRLRTDRSG